MNISLTDEELRFLAQQVEGGRYGSAEEVIHAGLQRLIDNDEDHKVKADELRKRSWESCGGF